MLEAEDEARALETLDALAGTAASFLEAQTGTRRVGEIDAREIQLGPVSILYGALDGLLVVTTAPAGSGRSPTAATRSTTTRASDAARDAAEIGDDAQIYAYVDLQGVLDLIGTIAALSDEDCRPRSRRISSRSRAFGWGDVSDPDEPQFGFFLGIR